MIEAKAEVDAAWRKRAQAVLPNGMYGHLSTKLLPEAYPQFFSRAQGARLWDVDGRSYLDYMCAFGPNLFGYADPEVDAAYTAQLRLGDTMTGPSPCLVEAAEALVAQVSHARWALFCKNGTDATTAAVMAARAGSRRNVVLRAHGSYHGTSPWSNPQPLGTTAEDHSHQIFFDYNDLKSLSAAVEQAKDDLAAIIVTPINQPIFFTQQLPTPEYAQLARKLCDQHDAFLITDEVRSGFRCSRDSSWEALGAPPDLSAWGKVLANGHSLSALLGNDRSRPGAEAMFVTGSFWASAASMAAGLVVMRRIRETEYLEQMQRIGSHLRSRLGEAASRHGIEFEQSGPVTMPLWRFKDDPDLRAGYFWCTEMLKSGIYTHPWHNMFINAAMTDSDVEQTVEAADRAFAALTAARATLPPNARLAHLLPE